MSVRRRGARAAHAFLVVVLVAGSAFLLGAMGSAGAGDDTVTKTFGFTGAAQTWRVPAGVSEVTIEAYGAQGGGAAGLGANGPTPVIDTEVGGLGGRAGVTIDVTPGALLRIFVGGRGGTGEVEPAPAAGAIGFNGGGSGVATQAQSGSLRCAAASGGGGGASDVRQGGSGIDDSVVAAAGGGGAGAFGLGATLEAGAAAAAGGDGGGAVGDPGSAGATGGTQTAGGAPNGGPGSGGAGDALNVANGVASCDAGGGGGGGLFGGGGGVFGGGFDGGSGAGGSSSPVSDTTAGVRSGDGLVVVTYTRPDDDRRQPVTAPIEVEPSFTG